MLNKVNAYKMTNYMGFKIKDQNIQFAKNFLVVVILILTTGCNNNLSRGVAESKIIEAVDSNQLSLECTFNLRSEWIDNYRSNGRFCKVIVTNPPDNVERKMFNYFLQNGILKLNKKTTYSGCAQWDINKIEVSENYKQYIVSTKNKKYILLSAIFELDEVVGIQQIKDANTASVEYKIKRKSQTPFGEYWSTNCFKEDKIYYANFVKYDDGWRFKTKK